MVAPVHARPAVPAAPACLSVSMQAEATTAWIGVRLRCRVATVTITILAGGRRAPVAGNPLAFRPRRAGLVVADWSNWCGARRGLQLVVRAAGEVVRARFAVLPACLQRRRPSRLAAAG